MYRENLSVRRERLGKAYDIADQEMGTHLVDTKAYAEAMNRREAIWKAFRRLGFSFTDN